MQFRRRIEGFEAEQNSETKMKKKPPPKAEVSEKKTVLGHTGGSGFKTAEIPAGEKRPGESEPKSKSTGSTSVAENSGSENENKGSTPIIWDDKPAEDPLLDTILADRYRIQRRVGEGGMGVVYEAEHVVLEKRVALKVLSPDLSRKKELVERFFREAKAASRIGHENIVDITDIDRTADGIVFFAMEFLDGMDLGTLIEKEEFIPWERAKNIIVQICRALGAAHAKGIIHRDLKPENIFLIRHGDRDDFVKVVDFGIAKFTGVDEEGRKLTKTGMIFGTPDYMSPEQASGKKPDHRIDVYALGVILYEMITGKVPFEADSFMGILTKHMFEEPDPPSKKRPDLDIPHDVEELILRAMHKDRDQRFHSMSEFAAAAKNCGQGHVMLDSDSALSSVPGETSDVVYLNVPKQEIKESFPPETSNSKKAADSTDVIQELREPRSKSGRVGVYAGLAVVAALLAVGIFVLLQMKPSEQPTASQATKEHSSEITGTDEEGDPVHEKEHHLVSGDPEIPPDTGVAKKADKEEVPPEKRVVKITVRTSPDKARVYLEDDFLGETPLMEREVGFGKNEQTLILKKKNHRDLTLSFVPDRDLVIDRSLQRIRGRQPDTDKDVKPKQPEKKKKGPKEKRKPDLSELKDPF